MGALLLGALLMIDGHLSRGDAIVLIVAWLAGSAIAWRQLPAASEPSLRVAAGSKLSKAGSALIALAVVAGGAAAALWGLTTVAGSLAVPEYLVAFFVGSIGTSLPEFVVDLTAIRHGQRDLAIGDALGSSFVDSTLSIAAGPLIAPVSVTAGLVVTGSIAAAIVIALVVVVLSLRRRHDWVSGLVLLALYVGFYGLWIAA